MSDLLWSFDQLTRFTKYEDPEVRYWAADRLAVLFPVEASDVIAGLLLDDHDATPDLVAEHLGRHGAPRHVPILLRGFRKGSGLTPARCIEALARIGYENTPAVAETALYQRDVSEGSLGLMVSALAEMAAARSAPDAGERAREFLLRRPELFAEPSALKGAIGLYAPADFSDLFEKWITALHFTGLDQVNACIRVLLEDLQLEDCGWCVRTDRAGRIDLDRTFKAIESGYDIDLREAIPRQVREGLSQRLQRGAFSEIATSLGDYIRSRAAAVPQRAGDTLPLKLDQMGKAFTTPSVVEVADRLEPAMHQWLIGLLVAAAVKATVYRNYPLEMEAASQDLDGLLALAGLETSCVLSVLPARLASLADAGAHAGRGKVIDWCVRTLEARGPFFPKAIALDTLGALGTVDLIPEITSHLSDDNAYIYGAAERALSRLGPAVIDHARSVLGRGGAHPDAVQSLVRVACEMGRESSLRLVLDNFDDIFETMSPEAASETVGLLGHQDLVPHLRRWLERSPAMVGHTLLLIGSIHNLPIPEEESILKAIDDYWKGASEGADGSSGPTGQYLM